jgi:hypothetical protein
MKTSKQSKLLFIGLLSLVLGVTISCKKTESAPSVQNNVFTASSQNVSTAHPFNIQDNFDLTGLAFYNQCTGELVDVFGIVHTVIRGINNNNKTTYDISLNLQGVKGIGRTTGKTYVVTDNFKIGDSYRNSHDIVETTVMETFKMNTAGSTNNFYSTFAFSYNINYSTGTFTVTRDKFSEGCR